MSSHHLGNLAIPARHDVFGALFDPGYDAQQNSNESRPATDSRISGGVCRTWVWRGSDVAMIVAIPVAAKTLSQWPSIPNSLQNGRTRIVSNGCTRRDVDRVPPQQLG